MKAMEILDERGIEKCPECKCATGDDWEFKDYSNKSIIICPQCEHEIYLEDCDHDYVPVVFGFDGEDGRISHVEQVECSKCGYSP